MSFSGSLLGGSYLGGQDFYGNGLINPWSPSFLFARAEPGVWYDPSDVATLFQNTAGTQPVTTAGQSVALMLDKSRGLTLGPELVTNGGFDTDTAWTKETGWTISGGTANTNNAGGTFNNIRQASLTAGRFYQVTFTISNFVSGSCVARLGDTVLGTFTANGTYRVMGYTTGTFANMLYFFAWNGGIFSLDNVSVRELPGNHATQATAASRPIYAVEPTTGRRNLLTYTEQFDNAAWTVIRSSVLPNTNVAPNGTNTAEKLIEDTTASNTHVLRQSPTIIAGTAYTYSIYAKAAGRDFCRILVGDTGGNNAVYVDVNLNNGSIASGVNGIGWTLVAASATAVGGDWYRVVVSGISATSTSGAVLVYIASGLGTIVYTGDGTSGIYIWGAQLEAGSTATAYQRVVSKYDVTEAGVPSRSYLSFDGIDDFMVTPTITPGIDKVQVFAGVRKLSDAAVSAIAELGTDVANINGSVGLYASLTNGANYYAASRGTVFADALSANTFAAPISNVVSATADISGDRIALRVNSVQVNEDTGDQGTGNYLAYPLYIGRRGGTSLPFNGNIYGMIVRFGANLSGGQVLAAERWLNNKTGAF